MTSSLPYISQPSVATKILNKIKEAKTPDRFTQDLLKTKFGYKGGNDMQFIPLAKKLGFLNSDGTPTDLYKKFRNNATSGAAIAEGIRIGYREIFDRNEFANNLEEKEFKGHIIEITGFEPKDKKVGLIYTTYENLAKHAEFETRLGEMDDKPDNSGEVSESSGLVSDENNLDLNLSYSINLVLPKTDDPAVFNAIFKALRENLLRK